MSKVENDTALWVAKKGANTMASKKFIQDRITGKIREIEKLNAKMERIEKAELVGEAVYRYFASRCIDLRLLQL